MIKKVIIILCVILALSIVLNVLLIVKNGIVINNKYDQRQDQRQFQFQGQLLMNFFMAQGDKIEWTVTTFKTEGELIKFIEERPPQESFFCKPLGFNADGVRIILCPHYIKEKK
jgi:hypothetical protein